jgi:hypothetical protein
MHREKVQQKRTQKAPVELRILDQAAILLHAFVGLAKVTQAGERGQVVGALEEGERDKVINRALAVAEIARNCKSEGRQINQLE